MEDADERVQEQHRLLQLRQAEFVAAQITPHVPTAATTGSTVSQSDLITLMEKITLSQATAAEQAEKKNQEIRDELANTMEMQMAALQATLTSNIILRYCTDSLRCCRKLWW